MKTFPAVVVANYFVKKGKDKGRPVEGVLKLIKLVHIAHGWHLGVNKNPLIREDVVAWKYGPVVRSVYDAFKEYGKRAITRTVTTGTIGEMKGIEELADDDTIQFLEKIWKFYRKFSGVQPSQLSQLTHKKRTPWCQTGHDDEKQSDSGVVILKETIKKYYGRRIEESQKSLDLESELGNPRDADKKAYNEKGRAFNKEKRIEKSKDAAHKMVYLGALDHLGSGCDSLRGSVLALGFSF